MSSAALMEAPGPSLEQVVLQALAEARARPPGRRPACPVCGRPMAVRRERPLELACEECGSTLSHEAREEPAGQLRLVT